jgi:hypothetical protein
MMMMMMMMMTGDYRGKRQPVPGVSEHPVLAHNRHTGSSTTFFKEWDRSMRMNERSRGGNVK